MAAQDVADPKLKVENLGPMQVRSEGWIFDRTAPNTGSSLLRKLGRLEDSWCPLDLSRAKLEIIPRGLSIEADVRNRSGGKVTAFELLFTLFDPLGSSYKTIYYQYIGDVQTGHELKYKEVFSVEGFEVGKMYGVVVHIGKVRTVRNGKEVVWVARSAAEWSTLV